MEKKSEVISRVKEVPWGSSEMRTMVIGEENGNSCTLSWLELPQILVKQYVIWDTTAQNCLWHSKLYLSHSWVSLYCLFCFWFLLCIFQLFYSSSLVGCSLYFPTLCYKLLSSCSMSILLSNSLIIFTVITLNSFSNSLVISTSLNSYGLLSYLEHISLLTHFA